MQRTVLGWLSLVLMVIIVTVGMAAIIPFSSYYSLLYLAVFVVSTGLVLFFFCSKCPCRHKSCGHIVLGPMTRLFPKRTEGKYSFIDITLTTVGFSGIFLFPQFWLFKQLPLLLLFWIFTGLLIALILLFICKKCDNINCPVKKEANKRYVK
jgi:hypothetical protein